MSQRVVRETLEEIRNHFPTPVFEVPDATGAAILPPSPSYAPIILPGDKNGPFETQLRLVAFAIGSPANEAVGPHRFGWNDLSVAALQKEFQKMVSLPVSLPLPLPNADGRESFFKIAACLGDYAMAYIGGSWVYVNGTEPDPADLGIERSAIVVRFEQQHSPAGLRLEHAFPEGYLFDPFKAVALWFQGEIATPFQPLLDLVGEPREVPSPYRIPPPPREKKPAKESKESNVDMKALRAMKPRSSGKGRRN